MSFQPLPNPPTAVVVPEMVPRGTTKAVFNPAADNFAQSLNPFSLYLQDFRAWVQNANQIMYDNVDGVYDQTVIAKGAAEQAVLAAGQQVVLAENQVVLATEQAARSELAAELAAGVANYRGRWVEAVGDATAGGTYAHEARLWLLLENVSDITASEPSGSNNDWQSVGGGPAPTLTIPSLTVNENSVNTITIDDYDANVTYIVFAQNGTIESVINGAVTYIAPNVTVDGTDKISVYLKIGTLLSDTSVYNFNIINVPLIADDTIQVVDFTNEASVNDGFDIV